MQDNHLNLFWNYGLKDHEDNVTRAFLVALRYFSKEQLCFFLNELLQINIEYGNEQREFGLQTRASEGFDYTQSYLIGISTNKDEWTDETRPSPTGKRILDGSIILPNSIFIGIESKIAGPLDRSQIDEHLKNMGQGNKPVGKNDHFIGVSWDDIYDTIKKLKVENEIVNEFMDYLERLGIISFNDFTEKDMWAWKHIKGDNHNTAVFFLRNRLEALSNSLIQNDVNTFSKLVPLRKKNISHKAGEELSIRWKLKSTSNNDPMTLNLYIDPSEERYETSDYPIIYASLFLGRNYNLIEQLFYVNIAKDFFERVKDHDFQEAELIIDVWERKTEKSKWNNAIVLPEKRKCCRMNDLIYNYINKSDNSILSDVLSEYIDLTKEPNNRPYQCSISITIPTYYEKLNSMSIKEVLNENLELLSYTMDQVSSWKNIKKIKP